MKDTPSNERTAGKDRRAQLVRIAYRHIAEHGFEGLRVHDVAHEAGINNATLHYYYPTKEALIQGVVDLLIGGFATAWTPGPGANPGSALEELRMEFADAEHRLLESPEQIVVYTELRVRALRDPDVGRQFGRLDASWRRHLVGLVERGMRAGEFRTDLDPGFVANVLMVQFKGIGFHLLGETDRTAAGALFAQFEAGTERWLTGQADREPAASGPLPAPGPDGSG
jgi:AcrR family transcriptional regulator